MYYMYVQCTHLLYIHISQINNPCGAFSLGDKFAIFTLTLDDITNDGTVVNSYGVTFSNIAGDDSVPETRVTGRGIVDNIPCTCIYIHSTYVHT